MKIDYRARSLTPKQIRWSIICVIVSIAYIALVIIWLSHAPKLSVFPQVLLCLSGGVAICVFIEKLGDLITHHLQI